MNRLQDLNEANLSVFINDAFVNIDEFPCVEAAAQRLVESICRVFTRDSCSDIVLARMFHSFEYQVLPPELQEKAAQAVGQKPADESIFLSLLGTYGDEVSWRARRNSQGHQAIPITRESIKKIPMMTRLFQQIGFDLGLLLGEGSPGIDVAGVEKSYSVFYVKDASGSPYIPRQEFVGGHGVKSVIGTGVMLPTNDVSIFIAFCRVLLDEETASNIAPLMSLFWQKAFPLIEKGFFASQNR